jgi:hypothetical protein
MSEKVNAAEQGEEGEMEVLCIRAVEKARLHTYCQGRSSALDVACFYVCLMCIWYGITVVLCMCIHAYCVLLAVCSLVQEHSIRSC